MIDRAEIKEKIISVLIELFELEDAEITEQSKLYEDLDIDSIDAIDLVVELKRITGKKIQPEDFKSVRTVEDVINATEELLRQ